MRRAALTASWGLAAFVVGAAGAPGLLAQEFEAAGGRQIVATYCSDCHAIGTEGSSPHPVAPPFRELHRKYDVGLLSEALVEGISTHPDMPEFEFDPEQAEAIIAYIKSLEPQGEALE